jgi:dolichol-phosphate mannosyltransferase
MSTKAALQDHEDRVIPAPLISVIVPVYNEEQSIRPFLDRLIPVLRRLGAYEIIFCLDPCRDQTEQVIREECKRDPTIGLLVMSRRFGQPAATMAGILNCHGQWCVVIDVDLQDPPELIEPMMAKALGGFDAVTARRTTRRGEPFLRKLAANLFYKLINRISDVPIPRNTGDFRIISRRVIEELRGLSEGHGFLRGLVGMIGFSQTEVLFEREVRQTGTTHYHPYFGSLKIVFNGIFGFSTVPLQMMIWTGFTVALLSAFAILVVIVLKIWLGAEYPLGVPTITILVLFIGGVQLTGMGVLGEYIGRIYEEVRQRPQFIIDRAVNVLVRDRRGPGTGA